MQAQENSDKAIEKSQEASEVRFASVNKLRRTLSDQTAPLTKSEVDIRVEGLNTQVLEIKGCRCRRPGLTVQEMEPESRAAATKVGAALR